MGTISSKYNQGSPKTKWRIDQCKGERDFFGFDKDCKNCKGKFHCESIRIRPFGVDVLNRVLVFAETEEDAEKYADKGHGHTLSGYREVDKVMPYEVEIRDDVIYAERA